MNRVALIICLLATPAFAVVGDFDANDCVNYADLAIFANDWLAEDANIADPNTDINNDAIVNFEDFALFAQNWWNCGDPPVPTCPTDPDAATTPSPSNHATSVAINATLSWSVADCNGETTTNDVWFAEYGQTLSKVVSNSTSHSYSPTMEKSHRYQWRIDTVNNKGTTTGTVWDFNCIISDAPTASNQTVAAYTYIATPITLSATDDGYPSPPARLRYVITALPSDVNAYVQDPVSGGQLRIRTADLPYKLSSWGHTVWFATTTIGTTTFKFKTWDGERYGNEATVTINVSANPQDCLSFDGSGYVTVPDTGDYFDVVHGRGIALFIKTRIPYAKILSKYTAGTAGWELYLIGGVPTVKFYDASGLTASIALFDSVKETLPTRRIDDGAYHNIGFIYDRNGLASVYEANETFVQNGYGEHITTGWVSVPVRTYSNGNSLIIGNGYKWEIDNLRSYSMPLTNSWFQYNAFVSEPRATAGTLGFFGGITYCPEAAVRFHMNYDGTNNTYTQIYDDKAAHLIGTFSSAAHVRYKPWYYQWWDAAAFHGVNR